MPILVALAGALLIVLVLAGQGRISPFNLGRLARAAFWLITAAAAVAAALRGGWMISLVLIGLTLWFGRSGSQEQIPRPPPERLSEARARAILGVGPDAGEAEIRAAYRRLMTRAHPDAGGSVGLAAELNAARDRLLKGR